MLIMGAAFGRLFGVILNDIFPLWELDPGIYALLGATGKIFSRQNILTLCSIYGRSYTYDYITCSYHH
jgi:hypothetical protein